MQTTPLGVQDVFAIRAVGAISPNTRARATTGFLGTVADVVLFPLPNITGAWTVPNQRCLVNGLPTISMSSVGIASTAFGPSGPMLVVQPEPRVSAF